MDFKSLDIFTALFSVSSSLIGIGIAWGVSRTMIGRLGEDTKELRIALDRFDDKFVTHAHFRAVNEPIKEALREVQRDVKKILMLVSKNEK